MEDLATRMGRPYSMLDTVGTPGGVLSWGVRTAGSKCGRKYLLRAWSWLRSGHQGRVWNLSESRSQLPQCFKMAPNLPFWDGTRLRGGY